MTNYKLSNELDYSIENIDDRLNKVNELLKKHDNELVAYFDDYYNPSLNQNSRLSEHDYMCQQLERMADYLLYADRKDSKEDKDGKKKAEYLVKHQVDYRYKNEKLIDDLSLLENDDKIKIKKKEKNYYVSNDTVVNKEDRERIPEIKDNSSMVGYLRLCISTELDFSNIKMYDEYKDLDYSDFVNTPYKEIREFAKSIEDDIKKDSVLDKKTLSLYKRSLREINLDEKIMKEQLLGVIRFKRLTRSDYTPSYDLFNFTDKEHVKTLINNYSSLVESSYEDTNGDIKHIVMFFEDLCEASIKEEYMRDILIWAIDGLSQKSIRDNLLKKHNIDMSQRNISKIINVTIPNLIVDEYKKSKEDFIFTNYAKGKYKECSKCGVIKIASSLHFRKDSKGKYGLKSVCKECDKNN